MNNSFLNVFIKDFGEYDLFYALDTVANSKIYHVNKRNVAILIRENDERFFFKPKRKRQINFEMAILTNNSYSGLPKFDVLTGDNNTKYKSLARYSPVKNSFDPLPGASFGYNFIIGKRKFIKYFYNTSFSLIQSRFNYYYEKHTNFKSPSEEIETIVSNFDVQSTYLYFNFNFGIHININKFLGLDIGSGFNLPFTLSNKINGYSCSFYSNNGVIIMNDTTFFNNTASKSFLEGPFGSTLLKLSYNFKLGKYFGGAFLGSNFHLQNTDVADWFLLGIKYYPFSQRS